MDDAETGSACRRVYTETNEIYARLKPQLGTNNLGFKILYGPPYRQAPILFIGDQPGGSVADEKENERFGWPTICEYATEAWLLARNMRLMFGLDFLTSCVGINANFFRAPNAVSWQRAPEATRETLERFSRAKLLEIIHVVNPGQIVVIGLSTLDKFGETSPILFSGNGRVLVKAGQIGERTAVATLHLSGAQIAAEDRQAIAAFI